MYMKNILSGFVIIAFFLLTNTPIVRGQEVTPAPPATRSAYTLPYPGILPDNPFYKIKVLRDKIWLSLIYDPAKKAHLYLLFADKKLAAAKLLAQKGNIKLAEEMALKGENNMTEMTYFYKSINAKPDVQFYKTLVEASHKHQELLSEIIALVPEQNATVFNQILEFSKRNEAELGIISQK